MDLKIGNKIKHFRLLKGFSQEKMSELLEISAKAYGNIERNITDVNLSRLEQIANVLGISLPKLFDFEEKNIINGNGNNNINNIQGSVIQTPESEQAKNHALEKSEQENTFLKEKITLLEKRIADLETMNEIFKNK